MLKKDVTGNVISLTFTGESPRGALSALGNAANRVNELQGATQRETIMQIDSFYCRLFVDFFD